MEITDIFKTKTLCFRINAMHDHLYCCSAERYVFHKIYVYLYIYNKCKYLYYIIDRFINILPKQLKKSNTWSY